MEVYIGNDHAIETGYNDEGRLVAKNLPGERTTKVAFPPDTTPFVAFKTAIAAMTRHIEPGAKPVWIESDDKALRRMLIEHYGLQITKSDRPDGWGEGNQ